MTTHLAWTMRNRRPEPSKCSGGAPRPFTVGSWDIFGTGLDRVWRSGSRGEMKDRRRRRIPASEPRLPLGPTPHPLQPDQAVLIVSKLLQTPRMSPSTRLRKRLQPPPVSSPNTDAMMRTDPTLSLLFATSEFCFAPLVVCSDVQRSSAPVRYDRRLSTGFDRFYTGRHSPCFGFMTLTCTHGELRFQISSALPVDDSWLFPSVVRISYPADEGPFPRRRDQK